MNGSLEELASVLLNRLVGCVHVSTQSLDFFGGNTIMP